MVHDFTHEIIYYPTEFGIFGLESLRVVEGVYAYQFMNHAKLEDPKKAFLIRNGRKPNDSEINYLKRLKDGEQAPHGVYRHNWVVYCAQNVSLKYPGLAPSTQQIREISENTFGHRVSHTILHLVGSIVRNKIYRLQDGYYGVNIWQPIQVICALNSISAPRNEKSISLLFNKIYKRDPIAEEIDICHNLELTNTQEIQNEIERIIKVQTKRPVSSKRGAR